MCYLPLISQKRTTFTNSKLKPDYRAQYALTKPAIDIMTVSEKLSMNSAYNIQGHPVEHA